MTQPEELFFYHQEKEYILNVGATCQVALVFYHELQLT